MSLISNDEPRIALSLSDAEEGFWAIIAEAYPEARSGDLSPYQSIKLAGAMRGALVEWLEFNCDESEEPPKTTEVMLHRIEYFFRDHDDLFISDSDEEYIANCISQGVSEGELCTTPLGEDVEIFGYWKINNNPDA